MKLKHVLILQNKIDLIRDTQAQEQYKQILGFIEGTVAEGAPIIPISAQLKYNIEVVCEYIEKKIPVPIRDFTSEPHLIIIRSFDVNKPGSEVEDLKGGVAGGSILKGVLRVGQEIEVRPGLVSKDSNGKLTCQPFRSKIVSLFAEQNDLMFAVPGGLIGVGTKSSSEDDDDDKKKSKNKKSDKKSEKVAKKKFKHDVTRNCVQLSYGQVANFLVTFGHSWTHSWTRVWLRTHW